MIDILPEVTKSRARRKNSSPAAGEADAPAASEEAAPRYHIEAVWRAGQILVCLENGLSGVDDLAEQTGASPAAVRAALATLARRGLVRRLDQPNEAWRLGFGWLKIAVAARRQIDIREIAQPVMDRMRDRVDETVILSVRRARRRLNIGYAESNQQVRRQIDLDVETALYVGAAGRALLTDRADDDLVAYLTSVAASDGQVINGLDVAAYAQQVREARIQGYAVVRREFDDDLCAMSAPVRDHSGAVVAALTISCPTDRFTVALEDDCRRTLFDGAAELSRLLGFDARNGVVDPPGGRLDRRAGSPA
jgi:DNA-binding IclR family transcriptional regulator